MPKKGKKKGKKKGGGGDGPLGPKAAGEAFAAAMVQALTDESGGDDGVDLDEVGGADGVAELVREEAEGALKDGGAAADDVWELCPDAAEMVRDAGAAPEIMVSIAEAVTTALAAFVTALTTGPQYEPGAVCEAVMPKDMQWHEATIVSYDEDAGMVTVNFTQYSVEATFPCDEVRVPEQGEDDGSCTLCGREMPVGPYHLFPKSQHARLKKKGSTSKVGGVPAAGGRACANLPHTPACWAPACCSCSTNAYPPEHNGRPRLSH